MKGGIKVSKLTDKEQQMIIAYYKRNPDIFIEAQLEVKLTWWQRFILKHMKLKMRLKDGEESR